MIRDNRGKAWTNVWRFRTYHMSWLLSCLCFGLLVGVWLGQWTSVPVSMVVVAVALIAIGLWKQTYVACVGLCVAGILLGLIRGSIYYDNLFVYQNYVNKTVQLSGVISADPTKTGAGLYQLQLQNISIGKAELPGEVYAKVRTSTSMKRGDFVILQDEMHSGFGSFQAKLTSAELLKHANRPTVLGKIREDFTNGVQKVVPEPEASLGVGFVVGQKSDLPPRLTEQLQIVGLTHIVVASGYNLTILVRFARRLFVRYSKYLSFVFSLSLAGAFTLFSGFSPSMNRAALVTFLSLVAWYYGRRFHPIVLILFVASLTALWYPVYVWSDVGWLLSFTAFAGVLIVSPILMKLLYRNSKRQPGAWVQLIGETISAQLMTLPIVIVVFGYVPLYAFATNLLVGPVLPFAMLATFIAGLIGMFAPMLSLLAMPSAVVTAYVVAIVKWFANLQWARIDVIIPSLFAWLWYGLTLLVTTCLVRVKKISLNDSSIVE